MLRHTVLAGVLVIIGSIPLAAQPAQDQADSAAPASQAGGMMERRQSMMADMQKMDAALQERIDAMNAATGEERIDAMAEVITLLAEQRGAMRRQMMSMMQQMGGRMSGGGMSGGDSSMSCCNHDGPGDGHGSRGGAK